MTIHIAFITYYCFYFQFSTGVLHMNLGIVCSLWNHLYWRDFLSIIAEFIPQMIFLNSIFGYLCFLIMYKWLSIPALADRYHSFARENFLRGTAMLLIVLFVFVMEFATCCLKGICVSGSRQLVIACFCMLRPT